MPYRVAADVLKHGLVAVVREAQKVERLRSPHPRQFAPPDGAAEGEICLFGSGSSGLGFKIKGEKP
jgi:hypothetical protein